jgi:hypothetical protein
MRLGITTTMERVQDVVLQADGQVMLPALVDTVMKAADWMRLLDYAIGVDETCGCPKDCYASFRGPEGSDECRKRKV